MDQDKIERGMKLVLEGLDCDMRDPNFEDTPQRYYKALRQMFIPPRDFFATFKEDYSDFVLLRDHDVHTLCPHHMLNVSFSVCLAYIPHGEVLGLSKLGRLMHDVNRGPITQERFTARCVQTLQELTGSDDAACIVAGKHNCMSCRGLRTKGDAITFRLRGAFSQDPLYSAFFRLTARRNGT